MSRVELLRTQLRDAHAALEETMSDVTQELAERVPPGSANKVGERYVHHATAEDSLVHLFLKGTAPLMSTSWQGRTGASEARFGTDAEHARRIRVDLDAARQYARAVYEATDAHVAALTEADLDRAVDMSGVGFGQVPVWWILSRLIIGHAYEVHGEVAAVKGVLGARGFSY